MNGNKRRVLGVLVVAIAATTGGYVLGWAGANGNAPAIPEADIAAPAAGTTRVLYSLDKKRNDKELIALIDGAKAHIYFAIYEFTLKDVADALVAARKRGVDVKGIADSHESASAPDRPIMAELAAAGIPVETERHADANGIMHIKALVTDSAYAIGSYNWTYSATTENDEILEIGTDPALVATYTNILKTLFNAYRGTNAAVTVSSGDIDYTEAPDHIGETARVHGTLIDAHTSAGGTVFLDFCTTYRSCPFSGVIFADDVKKFGDLSRYAGQRVVLTGTISSFHGRAEIKLSDPSALTNE